MESCFGCFETAYGGSGVVKKWGVAIMVCSLFFVFYGGRFIFEKQ